LAGTVMAQAEDLSDRCNSSACLPARLPARLPAGHYKSKKK